MLMRSRPWPARAGPTQTYDRDWPTPDQDSPGRPQLAQMEKCFLLFRPAWASQPRAILFVVVVDLTSPKLVRAAINWKSGYISTATLFNLLLIKENVLSSNLKKLDPEQEIKHRDLYSFMTSLFINYP